MFCCTLLYVDSSFAIISMGEERAGCFALFVFLVSRDCCVALPHDATGLSAVCDCGISDHTHLLFYSNVPEVFFFAKDYSPFELFGSNRGVHGTHLNDSARFFFVYPHNFKILHSPLIMIIF